MFDYTVQLPTVCAVPIQDSIVQHNMMQYAQCQPRVCPVHLPIQLLAVGPAAAVLFVDAEGWTFHKGINIWASAATDKAPPILSKTTTLTYL